MAWMINGRAPQSVWNNIVSTTDSFPNVEVGKCIAMNLIPAILGNVLGAAVFVGFVYWCAHLLHIVCALSVQMSTPEIMSEV